MVLGTIIGELIRIDDGIEDAGDFIKSRLIKGDTENRFTEGFVTKDQGRKHAPVDLLANRLRPSLRAYQIIICMNKKRHLFKYK